jgi:tetratricopeptide (TPR) repeat protein
MDSNPAIEEAKAMLLKIVRERDELRIELAHAKTAIIELENQNVEYDRLLSNANNQLYESDPKRFAILAPQEWIGTWQCDPEHYPALVPIEKVWRNGHLQQALNMMPAMLERKDFGVRHRINARILFSALIQCSGDNFRVACQYAEEALQIASEAQIHELAGKAQFHRGLCYYFLSEWANAKWCLHLASHLKDHAQTISECREKAERNLDLLPEDDPKRNVTPGFKMFCYSKFDKFVYSESTMMSRLVYS